MESTLDRIKIYIDYKKLSVSAFEKSMGFSNGSFASQLKNRKSIGVDKLENILIKYPDLSAEWLLTGKGTMLNTADIEHVNSRILETKEDFKKNLNRSHHQEVLSLLKAEIYKIFKASSEKDLNTFKRFRDLAAKLLKFINSVDKVFDNDLENRLYEMLESGKTPEDILLSINIQLEKIKDVVPHLNKLNELLNKGVEDLKPFDINRELDSNGEDLLNKQILNQKFEVAASLKDKVRVYKQYTI